MATFMTRVELKGDPSSQAYARLHEAMGKSGFSRTIIGGNGLTYQLSHAEYRFDDGSNNFPALTIMNWAKTAANSVQPKNEVTTVKYGDGAWDGLSTV